jgi:hypothetical protein
MKPAKRSKLAELHATFTDMLLSEMHASIDNQVPMTAADKSVIVQFLKHNGISAEVDDISMQDLRRSFGGLEELDRMRESRRKALIIKGTTPDDDIDLQYIL